MRRKRNESIPLWINRLSGGELNAIPPFETIHKSTKIKMQCARCAAEFERSVSTIYKKKEGELLCPICHPKTTRAFSQEEYNNLILRLSNNTVELDMSRDHWNIHNELVFRCRICGGEFKRKGTIIYSDSTKEYGIRCPFCDTSKTVRQFVHMTHDQYVEKFYQISGNTEYEVISQYTNSRCKMQFLCKRCGSIIVRYSRYALKHPMRCETCQKQQSVAQKQQSVAQKQQSVAQKQQSVAQKQAYIDWLKRTNADIELCSEYINRKTKVILKCKKCGCLFQRRPYSQSHGKPSCCCPQCGNGRDTLSGVNDIETVAPWMIRYFKNPCQCKKYKPTSSKKVIMVCPKCGHEKEMVISHLYYQGFSCPICSDGISYPNRYIANLLHHKGVSYKREYLLCDRYFDCEIEWNGDRILIEMDGGLGHGHVEAFNKSIGEQINNDKYKNELATEYGYQLIRIDCNYPSIEHRSDYIKNSVMRSDLQEKINFTIGDFEYAEKQSGVTSNVVIVSELWNNGIYDFSKYIDATSTCFNTTRRYIKEAVNIGLISNATYETVLTILTKNTGQSCPVLCNETGKVYRTICDAEKDFSGVRSCVHGRSKHAGRLSDGTLLTWRKLSEEEYIEYKLSHPS